jgi:methionyl-tRNA formyltransferase
VKIIFAGSPAIAVRSLEALVRLQISRGICELCGVLTNPDAARGRSGTPRPTDITCAAEQLSQELVQAGFAVPRILKFPRLDHTAVTETASLKADLLVSFAYGHIFPQEFLALFPLGAINIHPSLLPAYRGASPLQQALLDRVHETGVTIQRLAEKLDAGAVLAQEILALNGRETSLLLSDRASELAAGMLGGIVEQIAARTVSECVQDEQKATYCRQFCKADGEIDWRRSAGEIDAQIRAFTPWPLSWTRCNGQELYIRAGSPYDIVCTKGIPGTVLGIDKYAGLLIQTGDGVFAATRLQWTARKELDWKDFINGARQLTGAVLG